MFHPSKHLFRLFLLSLGLGSALTGCVPEHKGVTLKPSHGAAFNKDLGIPQEKQALSRVEWLAGGSSNQCLPTIKLAVLGDGTVFCWRTALINNECPDPFTHQGQIPASQAQAMIADTRDEMRASDPEDSEGCAGGWGAMSLLDREKSRYYNIELSCQPESLMQQNRQKARDIWAQVCQGNVGPQSDMGF